MTTIVVCAKSATRQQQVCTVFCKTHPTKGHTRTCNRFLAMSLYDIQIVIRRPRTVALKNTIILWPFSLLDRSFFSF